MKVGMEIVTRASYISYHIYYLGMTWPYIYNNVYRDIVRKVLKYLRNSFVFIFNGEEESF